MTKSVFLILLMMVSQNALAKHSSCESLFRREKINKTKLSDEDFFNYRQVLAVEGVNFFIKYFRIPSNQELARFAKTDLKKSTLDAVIGSRIEFWEKAFQDHSAKLADAKTRLILTYNDFIKAMKSNGITPRSASAEELYDQLLRTYSYLEHENRAGDLEVKHLLRVLGVRSRQVGQIPYPVLFDGIDGLRKAAQGKFPNSFVGFRDQRFGKVYNEETMSLIVNQYSGFIATAFMGSSLRKNPENADAWRGQFRAMVQLAEKRNLVILIKEVQGKTDLIPDELITHPRVRIVTHTIDLGDEMRIWGGMVIIPTNQNSLAGLLNRQMARVRGQTQIVFAPQRMMSSVATEKNHINGAHQVWATGALTEPLFPYSNFRSARVNEIAAELQINSAIIVEKSDLQSGPLGRGAPGRWQPPRTFDFEQAIKDSEYGDWPDGSVDSFVFYPADGSAARPIPAVAVIPGDFHSGFEDPRMLKAMKEQIFDASRQAGRAIQFARFHDYEDNDALSPWNRVMDRVKKFISGTLDALAELNRGRSNLNALMELEPELYVILSEVDNHNAWKKRILDNVEANNDPVNGPLVRKLREIYEKGMSIFEYLYRRQEEFDRAIPDQVMRQKLLESNVYIRYPERVRILKDGESFEVGPVDRATNVAQHGHVIESGKRGGVSLAPHARANDRAVIGHTHTTGILGFIFNPGMIIKLRSQAYALQGYNAQQNAVAVIYANGAIQLMIYDPLVGKFYADTSVGPLTGEKFFTSKPFVADDPNDLVVEGRTTLNNYE